MTKLISEGNVFTRISLATLPLILAACAVAPQQIGPAEVRSRVNSDQFRIYSDQEPVFKAIGFGEAVARALKYNLDYRLKLMESAQAMGLADVARFEMLPNLVASAGYSSRNNDSGGTSIGINTGVVSLIPSTSVERRHGTSGIELSWNILDFGVSYFRAKQQADQVLIAEERKRRVVQNILQDVRSAYWRAVGAQRLTRQSEQLMERVQLALMRSREAEAQGLVPPKDALTYQRLLLDAVQLLNARRQELEFAKRELAALMNITPGTDFSVVEEEERELMPVPVNVAELEELALMQRAELREEDYRVRITGDEAKRQLMTLFPGLTLGVSAQHDTNRYLYNPSWTESSARLTFNMLKLLSLPAIQRSQKAQAEGDEARRLALTMAVLTQVRVALERYRLTLYDLEVARESSEVDLRLANFARAALTTRSDSELELIRAETRALNSEYARYAAYAQAQAAYGRIYNSLGLDVVPDGLETASLRQLGDSVIASFAHMENETFVKLKVAGPALPPLALRFDGVESAVLDQSRPSGEFKVEDRLAKAGQLLSPPPALSDSDRSALVSALEKALTRNRLAVAREGNSPVLSLKLLVDAPGNGVRRAQWLITLLGVDGSVLGQTRYSSVLPAEPPASAIRAFAEAAVISNLRTVNGWLQTRTGK